MKLTGKKLILLLLYAPSRKQDFNEPITGRTRFMKMGFLFKEEIAKDFQKEKNFHSIDLPEYFGWKYGPFSIDFLNDLEFLINQEYIDSESGAKHAIAAELEEHRYWTEEFDQLSYTEFEEEVFSLSKDKGLAKAKEIWETLTDNQKNITIEFKDTLNNASLKRILNYVYKKFSDSSYTDKSVIRGRYLT